ncbi:MAG TPA: ATP-binding protein [Alphaproteobacteria bacterium]|jgi:signal transduction histidine kinase
MFRRLLRRTRALYRAATASLASRLVIGAAAIITISLAVAAVALPSLYRSGLERQLDFELDYLLNRLITRISAEANGELILAEPMTERDYESAYSGYYWQITSEGKVVLASRSLAGWSLELKPPVGPTRDIDQDTTFARPPEGAQRLRASSRNIRSDTLNKDLTYTVAAVRQEIDENIEDFRLTIVLTVLALGLVLVGTVWLQVRFGLGPLRRIPAALAAIRSGESDRLTGSFSAEVEPLAREINALLDHNAEVVERARTHVGNLAHALKTPIAVLTNEAGGREGAFAETVKSQIGIMKEQVDHHLSRARMAARAGVLGARTSVMPTLEGLARTLEKIYRERGIAIALAGPPEIAFRGERQDLEEMLGNLLDNACKYAKSRVSAKAMERAGRRLRIEIGDDGPGVPSEQHRAAQKRGVRLDEKGPGSGLGLSIVKDIAEIYGGSFTMGKAELGGLLAILDLPLAGGTASRRVR